MAKQTDKPNRADCRQKPEKKSKSQSPERERDIVLSPKDAKGGSPADASVGGEEDAGVGLEFLVRKDEK